MVTGFRVARGGAQAYYGITPDLATFAKILAGGLPGGAVTGPEAILERLDFEAAESKGFEKIGHQGTYNANPVCAATGIACLERVASEDVCERANRNGAELRAALNEVLAEERVPLGGLRAAFGFYFFLNPGGLDVDPRSFDPLEAGFEALKQGGKHPAAQKLRLAMSIGGSIFPASRRPHLRRAHRRGHRPHRGGAARIDTHASRGGGAVDRVSSPPPAEIGHEGVNPHFPPAPDSQRGDDAAIRPGPERGPPRRSLHLKSSVRCPRRPKPEPAGTASASWLSEAARESRGQASIHAPPADGILSPGAREGSASMCHSRCKRGSRNCSSPMVMFS